MRHLRQTPGHPGRVNKRGRPRARRIGPIGFIYQFPAVIVEWYDGDTAVVHRGAEPGRSVHAERVRIQGISAPELRAAGGAAARDHAATLAPPGSLVTLICTDTEKYGRLLAKMILLDGSHFGDKMVLDGFAVPSLQQ